MKSRYWFLLSLLLLVAAALCWQHGESLRQRHQPRDAATNATAKPTVWERVTRLPAALAGRTNSPAPVATVTPAVPELLSLSRDPRFPFRLRNSQKPDAAFFRSETAVLLRNALVETQEPLEMKMPAHLRAGEEPGSWVVQARGMIDQNFRDVLRGAGAEIVSYVPNNAFLIRGSANLAQQLRVSQRVQSVLPFEPYYKLDMTLLPLAVRQDALPAGRWLNLVVFPGQQEKALAELRALGAEVKSEQRFPFGHVVTIAPRADSLVALAQLPAVQNIEAYHAPVLMNDLSRVRLDVSTSTTASAPAGNWLSLNGSGVTVGMVDSGIDLAHGQLVGRIFSNQNSPINDTNLVNPGHGTFVAGTIVGLDAADGAAVNGSINGASYRGIAPGAQVYPISLFHTDYTNYGNVWLITNTALATNINIVNNSWGYPVASYGINSALFDEAVRDSQPFRPHDQPITHVFSVGNSGNANSGGTGGTADTIAEPGNGKNVISVGATEQFRLMFGTTNDPIATAHSDGPNHVSDLSSRGNVGIGIEGPFGRRKPDVVAPGDYVVSLRASTFTNLTASDAELSSGAWRYERGTSIAAGKVSGILALMQQFFASNYSKTNKPSLNKALLINRARTLNPVYDFSVIDPVSHQGWGIPSLSNTVPTTTAFGYVSNSTPVVRPIVIVEESGLVTNQLASGQFNAFDVTVPGSASRTNVLKITLAWTDPAGNPVSSVKLVNDLDLYVTNRIANGAQYEGNNFAGGSIVTQPTVPGTPSARDSVNNVENTFIPLTNAANTTFRVFVIGRKVNVNAVSANTNQIAQDYSLVISTDDPLRSVTVSPTAAPNFYGYTNLAVVPITNGIPRLAERVGANPQLWTLNGLNNANTNGMTNQWNFYVFTNQNYTSSFATNTVTNIVAGVTNITTNVVALPLTNGGPYVAFATFLPPNLARSRNAEADVDMFVTRSSLVYPGLGARALTNLDPAVVASPNTLRSVNRGGNELITFTNSPLNEVFYIGVKSEDQQGGTYGFFAAAAVAPFSTNSTNGGVTITLFPAMDIPDGTPESPGGAVLYGICTTNITMASISNSITYAHENLGDLVGTLTHNGTVITLNNHTISPTTFPPPALALQTNTLTYDDFRNPPDGPGDVTDLIGQDGIGLWIFEVYDNSPLLTGRVDYASIYIRPYTNQYSTNANTFYRTVTLQAGQSFVDFLNVPVSATNLDVDIIGGLGSIPGPAALGTGIDLLAGVPGLIPTSSNYSIGTFDLDGTDATNFPHLRISATSVSNLVSGGPAPLGTPSLTPGAWNFRIINNSAGLVTLTLRYTLGLNLAVSDTQITFTNAFVPLLDNYTTNLFMNILADRVIAGVDVGVAILHPRISDLVIHLVAPSGRKVLLFEDRAGTNGVTTPNLRANFSENTNFVTFVDTNGILPQGFSNVGGLLPIKFVPAPYSAVVSPPTLVTNMTNLVFGHASVAGLLKESPRALAHQGTALFMAGLVERNGTNDAFMASYLTPIVTNVVTNFLVTNFIGGVAVSTQFVNYPVTNWTISNFWNGPFSGYRGSNQLVPTPDKTFFAGVAANPQGVVAVGETRNFFPSSTLSWGGDSNLNVYDVDLGGTSGTIDLIHRVGTNRARVVIKYEGQTLFDDIPTNFPGSNLVYYIGRYYSGSSRFGQVIVNPVATNVAVSWTNQLTVQRSGGMRHSLSTLITNQPFLNPVPAPTVAPAFPQLSRPRGVALDSTGNVYVADSGNNQIVRFQQRLTITGVGTNGTYLPFLANLTGLTNPCGVAVASNGNIYVADTGNNQIKLFTNSGGAPITVWGALTAGTTDGAPGTARFNQPEGITIAADGTVYVADTSNNVIRSINPTNLTVTTLPHPTNVLTFTNYTSPRAIGAANFGIFGNGLPKHNSVNLCVADTGTNQAVWLTLSNGTWHATILGSYNQPSGVAFDGYGNVYVSEAGGHSVWNDQRAAHLAGNGAAGYVDRDLGLTGSLNDPRGIAADFFGNVFVADHSNNAVRVVAPYQAVMPTNAFAVIFPFDGPTNPVMGVPPIVLSRGLTNSVFGMEMFGAASLDRFVGAVSSTEFGTNGLSTNFIYAVGDAQFSGDANHRTFVRPFLTKFDMTGRTLWTRGYMPPAVITPTLTASNITAFPVTFGGTNYAAAPLAFLKTNSAGPTTPVTLTVAGGTVTGVSSPVAPITGPFTDASVFVQAPLSSNMPASSVALVHGTNIIAAGYSNLSTTVLTTNNVPFLMSLATTNGAEVWARASTNSGHFNSVAVYGTNILAVGAAYTAGNTLASSNLIQMWSLTGTQLLSLTMTNFGANRTSWLSSVVAIEALDRAYAAGSVINSDKTVDAVLVEIDLTALASYTTNLASVPIVSIVTNNITNNAVVFQTTNYGMAVTTDGVDLYVAVEGPGAGNPSDRQAGIFRYRAKNFYQPEESLNTFLGERTWATRTFYTNNAGAPTNYSITDTAWRLQIADTRAGGTSTVAQVLSWSLNFSYAASNTAALALPTSVNNPIVLLSGAPQYFQVRVPSAAGAATNLITANGQVRVTFNPAGIPTPGAPGNVEMFAGAATGSFVVSTNANAAARLRPGSEYYIAVQSMVPGATLDATVRVDFDRTELLPPTIPLTSGTPVDGLALTGPTPRSYSFEVPANAAGATFEIVAADGDVNLYLSRSNSSALPTVQTFDYRSANLGTGVEQIFLVTNAASATALTPGTWFLGVHNADNAPVSFTLRATAMTASPYALAPVASGVAQGGITSPGNAPNTLFRLNVPASQKALLFEVNGLTGAGDLIVRHNAFPLATTHDGANFRTGALPELVTVRTNAGRPSLVGDWYFGVLNPGSAHIAYTVVARQPVNGVLLSTAPIQISSAPGSNLVTSGTNFGFNLEVVPGETYQVQYATNPAALTWLVLTNIVAPPGGNISFLHSGALSNRNLYYRIQVVP
ncbi:MAG: hypothetical protein B9S33_15225 [Pedosphaera sp. Tous-C6FEB]|nr:MAG: hypothetical protein B9S33_15225 [Pedosphaera sp. Tous-C6FEB]